MLYIKNKFLTSICLAVILLIFTISAQSREIKIGLITTNSFIIVGSNGEGTILDTKTNKPITDLKKFDAYKIQNINGLLAIINKKSNINLGSYMGPLKLVTDKKNLVFCNKSWYRGGLTIFTNKTKKDVTVVNNLDLEDYLLSVVPSEIPSNWSKEALKAQSVAARSYAIGYEGRRKEKGYDLESTVEDQVYLGITSEKKSTTDAVKETKGTILVDKNNKPLIALYHASGGGYTDSIENLWDQKPSIYIQPKPDYDDKSPHFLWAKEYSLSEISKQLNSLNLGEINNITPLSKSVANRITWLKIIGTSGKATIRGEEFRRFIKLPSSKFNMEVSNNKVKFVGRGYGHGLGLSQWGAKALAERGLTYKEILTHYYNGAEIKKVSDD